MDGALSVCPVLCSCSQDLPAQVQCKPCMISYLAPDPAAVVCLRNSSLAPTSSPTSPTNTTAPTATPTANRTTPQPTVVPTQPPSLGDCTCIRTNGSTDMLTELAEHVCDGGESQVNAIPGGAQCESWWAATAVQLVVALAAVVLGLRFR